ncbi:MAG TPA: transposase [Verrucomicrobiae bacterium]|nr:transposase [Verrucomicrobiae bacterium]
MARPLRIDLVDGWYHVTARGNERRAIVRDDGDRVHWRELLEEWVERYGLRLHAYVLLDNHHHLLVQTPHANLSPSMQWLQVSYTVWFNRRHRRVGHLFQGRFHAVVLEADTAAVEVSRYVHLNPVRFRRLGLDKMAQARDHAGIDIGSNRQQIRQRLQQLREYPWSSYGAYVGRRACPPWLITDAVLAMLGAGRRAERPRAYQRYVETAVRAGAVESPWERLEAGLLLGRQRFVDQMRRRLHGDAREQPMARQLRRRVNWEAIVRAVERVKGESWDSFRDRHRDNGRDLALYVGRTHGLRLRELADYVGGIDYVSVASAVRRLGLRVARDPALARLLTRVNQQMHNE